jgi:putative flippase GtrA
MKRWLKFNGVGMLGVGVQLSALTLLKSGMGLHYLLATVVGVEAAILHNFVWHERWTWVDRTKIKGAALTNRLMRFHLANGVISITGNLGLMWLLVSQLRLNYFAANILSIGTCSIANFWASERMVFRKNPCS